MIFEKDAKIFNGGRTDFSTNGAGKTGFYIQENKVGPLLYTKNKNQKRIKDLNIKQRTTNP